MAWLCGRRKVAPCEGSEDWNMRMAFGGKVEFCRSLWGERGLKFYNDLSLYCLVLSLPVRGARIEVVRWLMLLPVLDRSQRGKCGLEGWSQLGDRRESGVIPREGSVGWNIANNIEGIAWLCFVLCEENTFVSTTSGQSRNYYIFEIAKNTKKLSLFTT